MTTETSSSISDQLLALIKLQCIDSRIDQVKKLRGDLPEEIGDLEDEKAGLETRIENFVREEKANAIALNQSKLDIQESEQLIKRYEEQQLQVRNNREYDALTKEIEAQKQRIQDSNAKILEIESSVEERTAAIEDAKTRLKQMEAALEEKRKELDEVLNDTKAEQSGLETKRNKAAEDVDARYLRAYDRLRGRLRDGRAVVALERGAAAGYSVPPQRQVEIRQRNRIVACEHTGRIIVDSEFFTEARDSLKF